MQIFLNGLITGLTIALLGLAFALVYIPTRVFHVALGAIYALVPFVAWSCIQSGLPPYMALVAAVSTGLGLSLICEYANHSVLERKRASMGVHLISSLGIYIIVVQLIAITWGNETRMLRAGVDATLSIGDLVLTYSQIIAAITSVAMLGVFYAWLQFSTIGLRFRALADNPVEFALRGYNVAHLRLLAFGISGLLSSAAALLVANDIGFDPHGGLYGLLVAIVAMIVGGRKSFVGAAIGGILLGIVRSEVGWFLSARWQDAVTFLILTLFLLFLPNGLLAAKTRLENNG